MATGHSATNIKKYSAPPTVSNIGPGFDLLGLATQKQGDIVIAKYNSHFSGPRLVKIYDRVGSVSSLPYGPSNVVVAVAQKVYEAAGSPNIGIELTLVKRMGIGTGLGSSASSSVTSANAVNDLLGNPLERESPRMLDTIVHGEYVATNGSAHGDNVLPAHLGGLIFIKDIKTLEFEKYRISQDIYFVLVSPNLSVNTGEARAALDNTLYSRQSLVRLSSRYLRKHLGEDIRIKNREFDNVIKKGGGYQTIERYLEGSVLVMDGLRTGNIEMLGRGVVMDDIITPVRAKFIHGYSSVMQAALEAGAYGGSISGSGPTMFFAVSKSNRREVADAAKLAFSNAGVESKAFITQVNNHGAKKVA